MARADRVATGIAVMLLRPLPLPSHWLTPLLLITCVALAQAAPVEPVTRLAVAKSSPIACSGTPFGEQVTIGVDHEIINVITGSNFNLVDVYQPGGAPPDDPLLQEGRFGFIGGVLAGTSFLEAVAVDLNGDGRDEFVTAHRDSVNGKLILAVFSRSGTALTRIDSWERSEAFTSVRLAAGDFDGSGDGREELAVILRRSSGSDRLAVYVMTGNNAGQIAQADGLWAGYWSNSQVAGALGVATGDLLLDGNDQLALVAEVGSGGSRAIHFHLLQFQPQTTALPIVHGDESIGSRIFISPMGTSFQVGEVNGGNTFTVDSIENIDASAGDVVDTAAAELIVHYQIRVGDQQFIGQRLHHFTTQRDADNAITGIELFSRGSGLEFDSSRVVQNLTFDPPGRFVSTVADVNRRGPAEVVLARADNDRLVVEVYRARVELEAAYTWERSGLAVRFVDQSGGDALGHEWDFGDGSGPLFEQNPVKLFAGPGTYQVRLRVQGAASSFSDYTQTITVAASGSGSGGGRASFRYRLIDAPLHEDSYRVDSSSSISFLRLAVGDMNKDGIAEIVTAARNNSGSMLRSVWTLGDPQMPSQFTSRHQSEVLPAAFNTTNAMSLLSVDFDGDSVHATIGNDCRRVLEPQVRQLMWHPPYFTRLQAGAAKLASFGKSTSGGTGLEQRSGSYTTHSVSAHIGASVGSELLGVEASVTATAGYSYQAARGELRGSGNSFQLDQSFSQANGEALLVLEENAFDCYSYQLRRRDFGELDDSAARLCERIDGTHFVSATDARFWDTELAASQIGGPPAQWLPLQREWASLALFRPVSNNASIEAGSSASHATDGLYDSRALIVASATGPSRPYLEVDLQSVQSISNVRIWPAADRPGSLAGARLYVSSTPFTSGDQPPSGAGVSVFSAQPEDGPYGPWSIWTRASTAPHAMLQGRYLRVQHLTGNRLGIAELQAFGDVHAEPPSYPDAVCDPTPRDNRHRARVWDAVSGSDGGFRTIDLRGDILWNGTGAMPGCSNFSGMPQAGIWSNTLIGGSADTSWNLSEQNTNLIGETTSFDSATRVGAEFDIQAGFIATVSGGGGYEYTGGVTEDVQTTSYWGSGLEVGGSVGGFDDQSAVLINACRYNPRPYAYRLLEVSNAGYQHEIYTVDYVVRQGTGLWERGAVPGSCLDLQINPEALIFRSGFEQT